MSTSPEEFLQKFHTVEGTTVAEKRRNFFILLHKNASLKNTEALNTISSNLTPRNFLEGLFKLEFLIYFRRSHELLHLLKEGNDVFVSKIIKQEWFFKEAFNQIETAELVNGILPCMSFSVRMKVLKKLSKYSASFDDIFDGVVARYGIFIASRFITGCSPSKIKEILLGYPLELTQTQLRIIYGKDPDLIRFYFDNLTKNIQTSNYKDFIKFLFVENRPLYDYLEEKYYLRIKFGRRLTKKIVDVKKEDIIKEPSKFQYNLYMKAVIRKLGKDSLQLLYNFLPPNFEDTGTYNNIVSRYFPKKYHYSLLIKIIPYFYKKQYVCYSKLINDSLLRLIPNNEERATYAKLRVDRGEDSFIKYLTTTQSVPMIKEKINLTADIQERRKLIMYLIDTCEINKDTNSLSQVIKYFVGRHKNDDISVHLEFIHKIESLFGYKDFTEEMWNYFQELLTIHLLKYDNSVETYKKIQTLPLIKFNMGTTHHQKYSYLDFLFNNDQPVDDLILELFESGVKYPNWGKYSHKFERYFLRFTINNNAQLDQFLEDTIKINCTLLGAIEKWNRKYPEDRMSFYDFPYLVSSFNYAVREFEYVDNTLTEALRNKIFTLDGNQYRNEYLQIYWDRLSTFKRTRDFSWFLKYDPLTIEKNFEKFLNGVLEDNHSLYKLKIWYKIRKFTHLHFDERAVQYCISKVNDEECLEVKPKFILCLSMLMKPEDYASLADTYKPANKSLNLKNEQEVKLYKLQCAIASDFKNTKSHQILPSLLNYCCGDYFKFSLKSLYSILYRTPEKLLHQHLSYLANKAVSVRKHALYFTCELSTSKEVENMLKLLNSTEGVQSLQKYMFMTTIKYFVKNPQDNFFEMVKLNMMYISKEDEESHSMIVEKCKVMPKKYKTQYIQSSWERFEKIMDVVPKLIKLKNALLSAVDEEMMKELPLTFFLEIIELHFLPEDDNVKIEKMTSFTFTLFIVREEKDVILEKVLKIVDRCRSTCDHLCSRVLNFFRQWYHQIMSHEIPSELTYLQPFINYFDERINPVEDLREFFKMFFLKTKLELSDNCTDKELSRKIVIFLDSLMTTYGPFVLNLFASEFSSNVCYFNKHIDVVRDTFYYQLIKDHPVPHVAMLVLGMVKEPNKSSNVHLIKTHNKILRRIKNIPDPGVQANLYWKCKNYLTTSLYRIGNDDMEIDNN